MLAIVWSLENFKTYLLGAKVTIKTDRKTLSFMTKRKFLRSRLMRLALQI